VTELLGGGGDQAQRGELVEAHQRAVTLQVVVQHRQVGQLLGEGRGPGGPAQSRVPEQIQSREVEAEQLRQPLHQLAHRRPEIHLRGERLSHLHHRPLEAKALGEEEPVHRPLQTVTQGLEQEHDGQGEHHREEG